MEIFVIVICIVAGLMLGSFFNVIIWRLPRGESIVFPGSHCPSCNRAIKPWENIPVISYMFLGGKCSGCKAQIPLRYPLVEMATAAGALVLLISLIFPYAERGHTAWGHILLALQIASLMVCIPIAVIDFMHYIIPDVITIPGIIIGFAASLMPGFITPLQSLLGILAGGGSLLGLGLLGEYVFKKKDSMGGGDIKLMAFLGALWGWKIALLGIMFGSILGALASLILFVIRLLPKDRRIPFGPFLAAGIWLTVLWGEALLNAYFAFIERLFLS
jgi:leader peptidase (prepilin peptidase)/N-methyltransferase